MNLNIKKIVCFVDHGNVFHNLQELGIRIDWEKMRSIITQESPSRILIASIMYMGLPKELSEKKKQFIEYLESLGYAIRAKPVLKDRNGRKFQKGVDTTLYKDGIDFILQESVDEAILVSGDSDFTGLIQVFQDSNVDVEAWSFKRSLSSSLLETAGEDHVHYLDDILNDITL